MAANLSRYAKVIQGTEIQPSEIKTSQPATPLVNNRQSDDIRKNTEQKRNTSYSSGQTLQNLYGKVEQNPVVAPKINPEEDKAKQAAYIDYQKLMKYLNFANAAQGGGTLTAGDQIEAQNNYQSQLRAIEGQYKQEETNDEETAVQQEYWRSMLRDAIDQKLGRFEVNEETGSISGEDWKSLWTLYEGKKDKMSEFQQEVMEFYLNNIDHDGVINDDKQLDEFAGSGSNTANSNGWVIADKTKGKKASSANGGLPSASNGQIIGDGAGGTFIYYDGYWYPAKRVSEGRTR